MPYQLGIRWLCHRCRSEVDPRWLLVWRFDESAFLLRFARELRLQGEPRPIESRLWQLGTWTDADDRRECFYRRGGELSEAGHQRLAAYQRVLMFHGFAPPRELHSPRCESLGLLEVLGPDGSLAVPDLRLLLGKRGNVQFDTHSGALWVGNEWLGEVPVGSKEFFLLDCLAKQRDQFVSYAELKREVLRHAGSVDTTDEATFCQGLKSRIKRKWIGGIDKLITTTNKADGYRLRGFAKL